jgi:isopenicillin-N epimerase
LFEPGLAFLNHGSFGACPRPVLEFQGRLREELERQPVEFLARRLPDRLDAARERLAEFLGGDPAGLASVPNATTGVNAVLRSLGFGPFDELLTTNHVYNACRNVLDYVAGRTGARVIIAELPFPCRSPESIVETLLDQATENTRIALFDHVTSPTGMVLPVEELVRQFEARAIDTLIDGAHAPGMLPLDLDRVGSAYYVGNCHKWLCAPKGAGFIYVRADRREAVRPVTISHGANTPRPGRSRFHDDFDWTGTDDPTPFLSVPAALDFMESLVPGGWPEVRERNRSLALSARALLAETLGVEKPCPDEMIGSIAALPLPDAEIPLPPSAFHLNPLQETLVRKHRIEVPIIPWPAPPRRLVRVSAQVYNDIEQYERLGRALREELG